LHKDNANHFSGVFAFCLGTFLYSIAILRLADLTHQHLWQIHTILEIFLIFSSGTLLVSFLILWVMEENAGKHSAYVNQDQNAYIVEHCAYLAHLLFFTAFLAFHTPDPLKPPRVAGIYEAETGVELSTLSPLMQIGV
jgi:hypothetical protein